MRLARVVDPLRHLDGVEEEGSEALAEVGGVVRLDGGHALRVCIAGA